jgi:DNA-binding transcriptional ArsR family regulator
MKSNLAESAMDALGNPVRRRILRILATAPRAVGEIAEGLPVSRPAVSKHLRLLEKANLVSHDAMGNRNVFRLEESGLRAAQEYLQGFWDTSLARFKLVAENTAPRGKKR